MKSLTETLNRSLNEGGLVFGDLEDFISEMADRLGSTKDVKLFFDAISDGVLDVLATLEQLADMDDSDDKRQVFEALEKEAKIHKLL